MGVAVDSGGCEHDALAIAIRTREATMIDRMSVRLRRWPIVLALAFGGFAVSLKPVREPALRAAGHALVAVDAVHSADAIVLPEWAGRAGAIEAADLVARGVSARVAILPEARGPAERELQRRGVAGRDG